MRRRGWRRAREIAGVCRRLALGPQRAAETTPRVPTPPRRRPSLRRPARLPARSLTRSLSLALSSPQVYIGPNVVAGYTHPETGKIVKDQAEHAQVMAQMASVDAGSHAPV